MISIVIPAYNEEKTIHLCIQALCNQKTTKLYEIIVVDNNSSDKTAEIIKKYGKDNPVRHVLEKQKGSGAARARGFDEASGDIILTTDADTIVPPDWIERMVHSLQKKGVAAVTGPCRIDDPSALKRTVFICSAYLGLLGFRFMRGHHWLAGFNYAVTKDVYLKAGGINKDLMYLDDIELSARISKHGKILYLKDMYVLTSNRRYKDGFVRGLVSYVKPFFELFYLRKHTTMKDYR